MDPRTLKNKLLVALNIGHLPESAQNEIMAGLGENISKAIFIAAVSKLSETDRQKFDTLSKNGDSEALYRFLSERIPTFDDLAKREIGRTIEEFKKIRSGMR